MESEIIEVPKCDDFAMIRNDSSPCHSVLIIKILRLCDVQNVQDVVFLSNLFGQFVKTLLKHISTLVFSQVEDKLILKAEIKVYEQQFKNEV